MCDHAGRLVAASSRPGTETEAVEIWDVEPKAGSQQGRQPAELQQGAVEAMQEQQGFTLSEHCHRPASAETGEVPPLHAPCQISPLGIKQVGGGPGDQLRPMAPFHLWEASQGLRSGQRFDSAVVLTRAASRSLGPTGNGR